MIECSESSDGCSGCDQLCVLEVLGEEHTIAVLDAVADGASSARDIATAADVPKTTLYRRLEALVDAGFLVEELHAGEDGHHFSTYRPALERLAIGQTDDGISVEIEYGDEADGEAPDEAILGTPRAFAADAEDIS